MIVGNTRVSIEKEFESAAEAAEWLRRIEGLDAPQADPVPIPLPMFQKIGASELPEQRAEEAAPPPAVTTDKKPRKPRSDAGQPRGPYKPREETAAAPTETVPATEPAQSAPPAAAAPAPAAAPKELTLDDLKASMTLLGKKHGIEANFEQLKKFKVEKVSALPKESYAAFNEAVRKAAGVA